MIIYTNFVVTVANTTLFIDVFKTMTSVNNVCYAQSLLQILCDNSIICSIDCFASIAICKYLRRCLTGRLVIYVSRRSVMQLRYLIKN